MATRAVLRRALLDFVLLGVRSVRCLVSILSGMALVGALHPARADVPLQPNVQLRVFEGTTKLPSVAESPLPVEASPEVFRQAMDRLKVPIRAGESRQLKVEMVDGHGRVSDVTDSPCLAYDSSMPWRLQVGASGQVTAQGDPAFHHLSSYGTAVVNVGFACSDQVGLNEVVFDVLP